MSLDAHQTLPRMPHRGHFTKRLRTVAASHWLIRQFVEVCTQECATREFVAARAGYYWRDLSRWESGETMPPIASLEACFNVLGRALVLVTARGKRVEIDAGTGHWSCRALRQVRRAAGLTQTELALRIRRCESTVQAWENNRTAVPVDGFCDALTECSHRLVVMMADERIAA